MKFRYLTILTLFLVFLLIPMSFADSSDNSTLADDVEELEINNYNLNNDNELSVDSYFAENNSAIEEPLWDDDFSNTKVSFTDRNTFYVNSSYSGSDEFGTVSKPFKDLNSAFSSLTFNRSVVNIYISKGTYNVSKTIDLNKNLNIVGESPDNTIICGMNSTQLFFVNKNSLAVNFFNLTFDSGNTYYGGAIYNNRSSLKLVNVIFSDNYAVGYYSPSANYSAAGGALYNEAGIYKIYNATFMNNIAKSSLNVYGAAIYNDLGSVSVLNSRFINNTIGNASYGSGGAIYNFNGFLTIVNSSFINNVIKSNYSIGGALYNYESHNVYVINSSFNENKIYGNYTYGSAITSSASLFEVVNSTFFNNFANGTAPENTTVFNVNGIFNFINSTMGNNTIRNPKKNILMCLEDQFVVSKIFDEAVCQDLPSKYDLRSEGLVTYAKSQGSSGACWAFTTLAALESYLLKFENTSYDISENNMKNLMGADGENGTDWPEGGNYQMALAYLLRWDGPIDENDDSFSAYSIIPTYGLDPIKHVQGAMFIPMRMGYLDNNQIKYAIMQYGALYTSIYGTSMIKNVYNSVAEIPNHAVTIVGWDDNYPASKFLGNKPPGNGAFIIKNSWGTSYGENGFGYVSYYDKTFAGFSLDSLSAMAFTSVENITNYKDIYQYDILGNTYESLGFGSDTAWLANQFEAISNNPLAAFGVYAYGVSDYLIDIYVNGDLKYSQEGKLDYAGFHTIALNQLVDLVKGDIFRINLKLTTFDSIFPIAIESARSGYSSKAISSVNQSFVSADGINWIDIGQDLEMLKISGCFYNKTLEQANVCLKAYTANCGDLKLDIVSDTQYFYKDDEITTTFNLTNAGDYVKSINVSVILDSIIEIIDINSTKGIFANGIWIINELNNNESAILNLTFKLLDNKDLCINNAIISCCDLIRNSNEPLTFNLTYAGFTEFIVEDISSLSKSNESFNISLIDVKSNPVSNANVVIDWGKDNIALKSDENGIVKLNLNLPEGFYVFNIYFMGDSRYHASNSSFNVNISKRSSRLIVSNKTKFYYSEAIPVQLTDENDNPLSNKNLIFKVLNANFTAVSDSKGFASLLNLKSGSYTVISIFEGDDLYSSAACTFNISIVKKNTKLSARNLKTYAVIVKIDGKRGPYLKITLKDLNGALLSNKKISITINSKTYTAVTGKDGVAKLQINIAKAKVYTAKICFSGDNGYKSSSTTCKITILKKKTSLKVAKKIYKKSKKVKKLTATLKDSKGKAIPGKKITFTVNGKKYSSKTNKKGIATVKVKLSKKKTYRVTVKFAGDKSYGKITKKSKVIIK